MENSQSLEATSIFEQWKKLHSSISMLETSIATRVNELESKEREIAETSKSVENSRKEVELRERLLDEKMKEVVVLEKQTSEKIEGFEVKLLQYEFACKSLKLKEKKLDDISKDLECRERNLEINSQILVSKNKEIEERRKDLELRQNEVSLMEKKAKESIVRSEDLWDSGTIQIACGMNSSSSENGSQADEFCRNIDANDLGLYIIEREKELKLLHWQLCELKERGSNGHENEEKGGWDVHTINLESKRKQNNKCFGFGRQNSAKELGEWDEHIKALELKKKQMKMHFQEHGWGKNEAHEPVALLEANKGNLYNNKKRRAGQQDKSQPKPVINLTKMKYKRRKGFGKTLDART